MNQQAIDTKIAQIHAQIVQQHPRSCKSCMGRGGRVIPSWEGCYETILCEHCTLNGLDPLDMTKDLIPWTMRLSMARTISRSVSLMDMTLVIQLLMKGKRYIPISRTVNPYQW